MSQYKAVVEILKEAKDKIHELLTEPEQEHHRIKITHSLQREIEYISMLTGSGEVVSAKPVDPGPATTMGGKSIERPHRVTRDDLEPNEKKVSELREKVEAAYKVFTREDSAEILKKYADLVIRGVARKAHLMWSKDYPESLSVEDINKVKEAIKLEAERLTDVESAKGSMVRIHEDEDIIAGLTSDEGVSVEEKTVVKKGKK